jgi:hypothetical protein
VCTRFAAANNVLEGMQPVHVQSPPTRDDSMRHTDLPNVDANFAAVSPADPPPMTTISYVANGVGEEEEYDDDDDEEEVVAAVAVAG